MSEDREPPDTAPEGSKCATHPDRAALVACPECGNYCCLACWHGSVTRCHECLMRMPMPQVPWSDPEQSRLRGFFGTLADGLSPTRSAAKFTRGPWRAGLSFLLLTTLPIALLSGVIPFTHTLRFGPFGAVAPIGSPSPTEILLDLLAAAGLGLAFGFGKLAVMTAPYLSLTKAYGRPNEAEPARQVMLYRGWLLVLGGRTGFVLSLVMWGLPAEPSDGMLVLAEVASLMPLMAMLWSMSSTARMAGVGPLAAMVVVLVPFVALFVVEPIVIDLLRPYLLPNSELLRESLQSLLHVKLSPSMV